MSVGYQLFCQGLFFLYSWLMCIPPCYVNLFKECFQGISPEIQLGHLSSLFSAELTESNMQNLACQSNIVVSLHIHTHTLNF